MPHKYPAPGDLYHSRLYPGQICRVISVIDAEVTFSWLNSYAHIDQQTARVNQFIQDFDLESDRALGRSPS